MTTHFDPASVEATPVPTSTPRSAKSPGRPKKEVASSDTSVDTSLPTPDYVALGVPPQLIEGCEVARGRYFGLGRLETGQIFEKGEILCGILDEAPDQKARDAWSKKIFGVTRRGSDRYCTIFKGLGSYRDRLVRLGLSASPLFHLAKAEPARIEELMQQMEGGAVLTAGRIAALVGSGETDPEADAAAMGGSAGLRARIAEKTTFGVAAFMETLEAFLLTVHDVLEPHRRGKRVDKGAGQKLLVHTARLLRQQLESLTWMAVPAGSSFGAGAVHVRKLETVSPGDRWEALRRTFDQVGGYESWPKSAEIGDWLAGEVTQRVQWALGSRAENVAATIAAEEKKAQAGRAKAAAATAREKAKAKAEAAKAAKKAKKAARATPPVADVAPSPEAPAPEAA